MPGWWGKKSGRSKDSDNSAKSSSVKSETKRGKETECKVNSFDEGLLQQQPQSRNSPRVSREFSAGVRELSGGDLSGFSGFDSASSLDRGHPLPQPLRASNDQVHGAGSGSGSLSGSSVSSSGSSDDHPHAAADQATAFRGHGERRLLSPLQRSPGRGSRCSTTPVSPLHARINGMNLDSPGLKLENELHKLPLPPPPGSPASPSSALPTPRSPGTNENSGYNASKWRKGKLLGRGTFGHVYLGFNR